MQVTPQSPAALRHVVAVGLLLAQLVIIALVQQARAQDAWMQKVDPALLDKTPSTPMEMLIVMHEQADLSRAALLPTKLEKGEYVYEALTAVAQRTQPALVADLAARGAEYRRYWVRNMVWAEGDQALIEVVARRSDVARVFSNPSVRIDTFPSETLQPITALVTHSVEDTLLLLRADEVWARGITGEGVVVGGQDTGYEWDHPALINQYRGWNGTQANHDYAWHDAIHHQISPSAGANRCGFDSPVPCDDYSPAHGTHTMGTMVGEEPEVRTVGMAPGATWIGCRNMERGYGTPTTYAECYEWFIAPYPLGGDPFTDGDPARAPHVINNSWSCPPSEGCLDPNILREVVENVRAAGIVTVHAAGNYGSAGCSTVYTPAAIYDASFTVGATTARRQTDMEMIASFSSRGPVKLGDNNPAKPDVVAPGVGILSTYRDGAYAMMTGTSMAAPHVAGLVALVISARPNLAGHVDEIEQIIQETAVRLTIDEDDEDCDPETNGSVPNYVFGWGRIDALSAYERTRAEDFYNHATLLPFLLSR